MLKCDKIVFMNDGFIDMKLKKVVSSGEKWCDGEVP